METEHANYCIQCKDHTSGKTGSFLYKERTKKGEFIAISPVFPDLAKLFPYMKIEGWERNPDREWNSMQRPTKTSFPDGRIKRVKVTLGHIQDLAEENMKPTDGYSQIAEWASTEIALILRDEGTSLSNQRIKRAESDFNDDGGLDDLAKLLQALSKEIDSYNPKDLIELGCDEPTIDCRLRYHERSFIFLTGDSSYDQDHRGHWGASSVGPKLSFDDAKDIGAYLLDQVLDSIAESE